jgi:5-methylcytosine-specific restriction endonuclease McrA
MGPSAEVQLEFLQRISRILDEGRFTTTYKFALLIALTNVAVRRGRDDGSPLTVDLDEIALEFIDMHWGMARPFPGSDGALLRFSSQRGRQAAIVGEVAKHAATTRTSHVRVRAYRDREARLRERIRETLTRDVLYRLQSIGPSRGRDPAEVATSADEAAQFIYSHPPSATACKRLRSIELKPGVPACLRSLRPVIVGMAQARWALWMRSNNPQLGPDRTLEAFMFGSERVPLASYAERLYELQGGRCFYLDSRLRSPRDAQVDHFLPRARYALDAPQNLVLASPKANNDKRDHIASERHLARWVSRNRSFAATETHIEHGTTDQGTAYAVARWMYAIAERDAMQTWDGIRRYRHLEGEWRRLLPAG